jgi:hypothetical protein
MKQLMYGLPFICDMCGLVTDPSPMWEECCVPCNITLLTTDLERLVAYQRGVQW